jgi:serine/threonine protein kinase
LADDVIASDSPGVEPHGSHAPRDSLATGPSNDEEAVDFDDLVIEFIESVRRGDNPSSDDFLTRYPNLSGELRELLPLVQLLEESKRGDGDEFGATWSPFRTGEDVGPYRVLRELGRGGMGVVYETVDRTTRNPAAVKVLRRRPGLAAAIGGLHREARIAAGLNHPRIVPIYSFGDQGGVVYFSMGLVNGIGLDRVIRLLGASADGVTGLDIERAFGSERLVPVLPVRSGRRLLRRQSWIRFAKIAAQVGSALWHAHQRGVIHRDIKPANLLIDRNGSVWVTDFGLALECERGQLAERQRAAGTLRYMAPEQINGWADARSDIYGLGLTLYELCTLSPPFAGLSGDALKDQILQTGMPDIRQQAPDVPLELARIIDRATAVDPGRRPQTSLEMVNELARVIEQLQASRAKRS